LSKQAGKQLSKRRSLYVLGLLLVAASTTATAAAPDPQDGQRGSEDYLQVWIGAIDTDEDWDLNDPADGSELTGDIGTLPYFGGGAQRLYGGRLQAGYEGGGLVTFKNDSTRFYGNNGGVRIEIDNILFSTEFYMGGVLSVRPVRWLRVYAGGGPAVAYGYLSDDDDSSSDQVTPASSNIDISSGGHSVSITLYGRAGFEFETPSGFTFGGHARYAPHEFDFDDGGKLKLDSVQYFLSLGQRL
jgi:hypothetical protein